MLERDIQRVPPGAAAEDALCEQWSLLVARPESCHDFLSKYVARSSTATATPPEDTATALRVVYTAAALVTALHLDVLHTAACAPTEEAECAQGGSGGSAAAATAVGDAVAVTVRASASVLVALVERCIVPSTAQFQLWREALAGTAMGLALVGRLLRAYASVHLRILATPNGGSRSLATLGRVVYGGSGGHGGAPIVPVRPSDPVAPAPVPAARAGEGSGAVYSRLTIAHATYLSVARLAHKPAAGLALLLEHPVLILDGVRDGVMLADYIRYYTEGAALLAELGRYAEAAECIYNVTALHERQAFPGLPLAQPEASRGAAVTHDSIPAGAQHAHSPHHKSRTRHREDDGSSLASTVLAPWARVRSPYGLLRVSSPRQSRPGTDHFTPSLDEASLAADLYVHASKLGIVLGVLGFGGEGGCRRDGSSSCSSGGSSSSSTVAALRATHVDAKVIEAAGQRLAPQHMAPYLRLWRLASQRDLAGLWRHVSANRDVFVADGLNALVEKAVLRLPRFVVLDMAAVYDTVSMLQLVLATNSDRLAEERGHGDHEDSNGGGHEQRKAVPERPGAAAQHPRPVDVNERQEAIQLLLSMQEEGQLVVRLHQRTPRTGPGENEEAAGEKVWVVEWSLPTMLSLAHRTAFMAGRNAYGNSCVSFSSGLGTVGASAPSAASAAVMSALRRTDWLRAHLAAAERDAVTWQGDMRRSKNKLEGLYKERREVKWER